MPIHDLGNGCYKWGNNGKEYCGEGARKKAIKQMRSAYYNGYKGKGSVNDIAKECEGLTHAEINTFVGDKEIPYMIRVAFARQLGVPEKPQNYNQPLEVEDPELLNKNKPSPQEDVNSDGGSLDGNVLAKKLKIPKDKKGKSQLPNAAGPF